MVKLTNLEKMYVNRKKEVEKNIEIAERLFSQIDLRDVKNVLEVGCGIGLLSTYLAKEYEWNVIGIDLDFEQIEIAKKDYTENEHLKFLEADVTKLLFEDNEFDMVLSFDVLHHIPNWEIALSEISRVSKQDGFYILSDLVFRRFVTRTFKYFFNNMGGFFTINDINNHLKRDNFEIIYKEKPNISLLSGNFSVLSQKHLSDEI